MMSRAITIIMLFFMCMASCNKAIEKEIGDSVNWESYLGGPHRNHFSSLSEITPDNVDELEVVWRYYSADSGQMQMNPVIRDGVLYGVDARVRPFALNAETGLEIWRFADTSQSWHSTHRGVAFWDDGKQSKRVLVALGPFLYSLDAATGKRDMNFGENGRIDLHTGLPEIAGGKFIASTTPGTIYKELIIMPTRVGEGNGAAPGDIRAFNVRTGQLEWTFHTIPHPGESGYEGWENKEAYLNEGIGGANNWAGMALDEERGIIYVPTGSLSPDFYGGDRAGDNRYGNCLLALDAESGRLLWYFQFTHHDIWDRDLPAPPNLIYVEKDGVTIPAVAQITKQGDVFLFNRESGEPLFEVNELKVPASKLVGEITWTTQPKPVKPKAFARQAYELTQEDISPYAPNRDSLLKIFNSMDRRWYAPGNTAPVLMMPGFDGGAEWGGAGADPNKGILYVNSNEIPWIHQLQDIHKETNMPLSEGEKLYAMYCTMCHLSTFDGMPESGFPSLHGLSGKFTRSELADLLQSGKGMMPGFPQLDEKDVAQLYAYIGGQDKTEIVDRSSDSGKTDRYRHMGYRKFLDENGLPAIAPPWGTLSAIDMNSGDYLWRIPFGNEDRLPDSVGYETGTENYGGPVITENGLLMIAATRDGYFRIYDRHNGTLLWKYKLPAPSFSTPATYAVNGKQYIVLACGGEKLGTQKGNQVIAFALPGKQTSKSVKK